MYGVTYLPIQHMTHLFSCLIFNKSHYMIRFDRNLSLTWTKLALWKKFLYSTHEVSFILCEIIFLEFMVRIRIQIYLLIFLYFAFLRELARSHTQPYVEHTHNVSRVTSCIFLYINKSIVIRNFESKKCSRQLRRSKVAPNWRIWRRYLQNTVSHLIDQIDQFDRYLRSP